MPEWLGWPELIIILIVVLVVFGPKQLPKLGKMFGKTMKSVREGVSEMNAEMKSTDVPQAPAPNELEAPAQSEPLTCESCGTVAAPGTKFCPECGTALEVPAPAESVPQTCTECGTVAAPGTKFCPECGAAF